MLIDSTHKRWFLGTAVAGTVALAIYAWFYHQAPGGLTGQSTLGLWYGILGTGLMVLVGLLSGLRKVPAWWWIGSRQLWLRGHIWLGLLSGVFILCHSGFRWGGLLTQVLWVVLGLTLLTGVYGLLLQQFLPRLLTSRIPCEAPYEQIPHLCQVMRRKADDLLNSVWAFDPNAPQASIQLSQVGQGAKVQLQVFYEKEVRPFLTADYPRASLLTNPLRSEAAFARLRALPGLVDDKKQLNELERLCDERRLLAQQERLYHWLHGWLLLHIPLSVALLVLGLAHIVMALYY